MEITSIFDSKTNSPSVKQDSNTGLIIGNGFDLDLGMKTRYIDFASWANNIVSMFANDKKTA